MKERFFRNRTAVFTVVFVLLVGLVGILAPVIAPNDPYETNILNKFASYSLQYPLGTDQLGRCVLSRMIYGIRPTLGLALLTMFGTISLGAILGIMAGYFRGIVEEVIMRVVDVMLSFPSQIMVFAVVALLGVSVQNVIIASAGKISASAFRRYAPAHHDRHCNGHETSSSDCRRTYHGDRCHHPV